MNKRTDIGPLTLVQCCGKVMERKKPQKSERVVSEVEGQPAEYDVHEVK